MKFVAAVCVLLLVHSACFGKCRILQNNSNLKKRMEKVDPFANVRAIAQELEQRARHAHRGRFTSMQYKTIVARFF